MYATISLMLRRLKRWWKQFESWLTRAAHFDLLFVRTGLLGLIFTGASGIVTATLAWLHAAPAYQVVLGGMFGMGAALFIANQSLKLITAWKAPASISRQQARQLDRRDPRGIRLGGSTAIIITLLASAIIIVGGLYASGHYSTWRDNVGNTYIYPVFSGIYRYDAQTQFGVNITEVNMGNLPIDNINSNYQFKYPVRTTEVSEEEEDAVMRSVVAGLPTTMKPSATLYPHTSGQWFTANDPNMTKELWDDVIAQKRIIYLFLASRYNVAGYNRITEVCYFIKADEMPNVRLCGKHNLNYWLK
jgi:hypothetical protein